MTGGMSQCPQSSLGAPRSASLPRSHAKEIDLTKLYPRFLRHSARLLSYHHAVEP